MGPTTTMITRGITASIITTTMTKGGIITAITTAATAIGIDGGLAPRRAPARRSNP